MSDRDCQHGQLTRVCDRCADAAEIEQLRAELAAAREREARMQWQPIETAPRDGSSVLLLGRGGRHADGFWEAKAYAGNGCWVWPYVKCEPLHWMPLPAPPGAALAEGGRG